MNLKKIVKATVNIIALIAMCVGLYFFEKNVVPKKIPENKIALQSVKFKTNGYITKSFLMKALAIEKNSSIVDIDIFALRNRLLNISQIKDVYIERQFPATIAIKITERIPLLKFAIKRGDNIELLFVDSSDGVIFRGSCLPKTVVLSIPSVDLNLEKSRKNITGYKKIQGVENVARLVMTLCKEYPEIYKNIKKFSLKKYDPRDEAMWSRIEIFQKEGQVISLSPNNIDIQLLNLDYLLHEHRMICANAKRIDLANIDSAIVEK